MASVAFFRTIKPAKKIRRKFFNDRVRNRLFLLANKIEKDFEKTTRTWEHKPRFRRKLKSTGEPKRLEVYTRDKIYRFVNEGTRPHIIRPRKKGGVLVFPAKFRPKTTPMLISSKKGFKSKAMIFAREVKHPGTQARKFDKVIAKKYRPKFRKELQLAYNEAARYSGYGVTRKI